MRHSFKENNQPARGNMTSGFVILTKLSAELGGRVAILADDIRLVEEVTTRKVESLERPGEFEYTTEHCQVVALDSDGKKITVYVRDSFDDVMRSWSMARNERVVPRVSMDCQIREGAGA